MNERKQVQIKLMVLRDSQAFIQRMLPTLTGASLKAAQDRLVEISEAIQAGEKKLRSA